jgi:ArsR family transcriptional regulator
LENSPTPSADALPDVVLVTKAVGDPLRANILKVLSRDSFGVLELGTIFDMAQPAMSHHLKKLSEAGLVKKRREGTSIFYQRTSAPGNPLLSAIFNALDAAPLDDAIATGVAHVHHQRVEQSRHFFANQADALSKQTTLICTPQVYTPTVVDVIEAHPDLTRNSALEIGPGSGTLLKALSPHFQRVTGLDNAPEMLNKTAPAVTDLKNVTLLAGDFIELSAENRYDLIVAAMVVHHLPSPPIFFSQAARLLAPGGLLVVAELCDHDQDWVKDLCGDVWLGFEPGALTQWAAQAGLLQTQQQFLAQRNGFRVQVSAFAAEPHPALPANERTNGSSDPSNEFENKPSNTTQLRKIND